MNVLRLESESLRQGDDLACNKAEPEGLSNGANLGRRVSESFSLQALRLDGDKMARK